MLPKAKRLSIQGDEPCLLVADNGGDFPEFLRDPFNHIRVAWNHPQKLLHVFGIPAKSFSVVANHHHNSFARFQLPDKVYKEQFSNFQCFGILGKDEGLMASILKTRMFRPRPTQRFQPDGAAIVAQEN